MQEISKDFLLIEEIRNMYSEFKLCGNPEHSILNISDNLLSYVLTLFRDQKPVLPNASKTEWNELVSALIPHRILPLLYWKIKHLPPEFRPPKDITTQLLQGFLVSSHRCLQMERQLRIIIEIFDRKGISVLVLKGQALARTVYPTPESRPSGDIDLLVCPEQMIQARKVLIDRGYNCQEKRFEAFRDFHNSEEFIHKGDPNNNYEVEVHWALHMFSDSRWKVNINEIVSRAVKVETPDLCFKMLHPVDNLMHASLHMIIRHSHNIRLIWIYDCALLAQQLTLTNNWEMLIKKNYGGEMHIVLKKALEMARLWYNSNVPPGFDGHSSRAGFSGLDIAAFPDPVRWLNKQIFKFPIKLFFSNDLSLYKKIHYLFQIIFPHPDVVRMKYPPSHSWLLPLSYLQRWLRWIKKLILHQ